MRLSGLPIRTSGLVSLLYPPAFIFAIDCYCYYWRNRAIFVNVFIYEELARDAFRIQSAGFLEILATLFLSDTFVYLSYEGFNYIVTG